MNVTLNIQILVTQILNAAVLVATDDFEQYKLKSWLAWACHIIASTVTVVAFYTAFSSLNFFVSMILIFTYSCIAYKTASKYPFPKIVFFCISFCVFSQIITAISLYLTINLHLNEFLALGIRACVYPFLIYLYRHFMHNFMRGFMGITKQWVEFGFLSVLFSVMLSMQISKIIETREISRLSIINLSAIILIIIASCIIIFRGIKNTHNLYIAQIQSTQLQYHQEQIKNLLHTEQFIRRIKHDTRHHNLLLIQYIKEEKYDSALEHLYEYEKYNESQTFVRYCENDTVNSILSVYSNKAKANNIKFENFVTLEKDCVIPQIELTVLFSNILENALNAAIKSEKDEKQIYIHCIKKHEKIILTCHNTCSYDIMFNNDGVPINKKNNGIGVLSVINIVKEFDGDIIFEKKEDVFTITIIL